MNAQSFYDNIRRDITEHLRFLSPLLKVTYISVTGIIWKFLEA
ncbi:hypothetical protein ES705_27310 [subsurface metagenome]